MLTLVIKPFAIMIACDDECTSKLCRCPIQIEILLSPLLIQKSSIFRVVGDNRLNKAYARWRERLNLNWVVLQSKRVQFQPII